MKKITIKHRRVVQDKLIPFGFERTRQGFEYSEFILDGQFELKLFVKNDGTLYSRLVEAGFDDEYILHLVEGAEGEFVGRVKAAYDAVLDKFIQNCSETDIFQSEQAHAIIEYVRETYGDELEYLWEKFPENAVFRRKDTQSWYCALLILSRRKLGFDSDEIADIIDLRMRPESATEMIDGKKYLRGYHMNKQNWFTIVLDGSVPTEEIFRKIDESYLLACKNKKS